MAIDEAILEAHRLGESPATLRLYRWVCPTISLGYAQRVPEAQLRVWREAGATLVRRPTGGRAVLHTADVTYSVVTQGLPDSVSASYRLLSAPLVSALASLGLQAGLMPGEGRAARELGCFAQATPADLTAGGAKICGSAQVRRQGTVLQHGTMYLRRAKEFDWLSDTAQARTLTELLARPLGWQEVAHAIQEAFQQHFPGSWRPGVLSEDERRRAELRRPSYEVDIPPA